MTYRFYTSAGQACRTTIVGEHKDGVLKLAAARCSNRDHFNRKIGRSIAEGRLKAGKLCKAVLTETCDVQTFLKYAKPAANDVCTSKKPFSVQSNTDFLANINL